MKSLPGIRERALIGLLAFAAFAYVTNALQLTPFLTALSEDFGKSESTVGQLATIGALVSTVTAITIAPWMQRWPRSNVLAIQSAVLLLSVVLTATAQSFGVLVAARIIGGIGGGALIGACFTAASEIVTDRGKLGGSVAIVASGTTMATLAGLPILALLESWFGWRWASASIALLFLVVIVGVRWLPDARIRQPHDTESYGSSMQAVLGHRPAVWMLLTSTLLFVAYIGWIVYFAAYIEQDFGGSAALIGVLFLVGGLSELAGNAGGPALFRRFPVYQLTLIGAVGLGLTLLGSGVVFRTAGSQFILIALLHICTSFVYIGSNILLLGMIPGRRGTLMALASATTGFGGAVGALLGGVALAVLGDYEQTYQVLGLVMLASAGCVVASRRALASAG